MSDARWLGSLVPIVAILGLCAACSSGGTTGENTSGCPTPTNPSGEDPFATPNAGATGKFGSRDDVCGTYACALLAMASKLSCGLDPAPKCPDVLVTFEKNAFPGKCVEAYDLGTVDNCVKRVSTYKTCPDFNDRKCEIRVKLLPDGKCPGATSDAGTDTSTDDVGADTLKDAPADLGDGSGGG